MHIWTVPEIPEIQPDDRLAPIIEDRVELRESDILVVASTIISKAEDRYANLSSFSPSDRALALADKRTGEHEIDARFAQAVLDESTEILIESPFFLTVTHFGHIGVNAGIDKSNAPGGDILLLPENPSQSAARIRNELSVDIPVIVTDTSGRPFRYGQCGVAIGWNGMPAHRDWRGETDRNGHTLESTVQCVVDELAAASNLVTGEGDDGKPVTIVRDWKFGPHAEDEVLFREAESDIVRQALQSYN